MEELGLESLEKAVRRVGRDPVEAARDSSCCWSWDDEPCSVDDEAPISLLPLSLYLARSDGEEWEKRRRDSMAAAGTGERRVEECCFAAPPHSPFVHGPSRQIQIIEKLYPLHPVTCALHQPDFPFI